MVLLLLSGSCGDSGLVNPVEASFDIDTLPGLVRDVGGSWHLSLSRATLQTIQPIEAHVTYSGPARNSTVTPNETIDVVWESSHSWVLGDTLVYIFRRSCPDIPEVICVFVVNAGEVPKDTVVLTQFAGIEVPTVNEHSLSDADGEVRTIFAPIFPMLGDTVTVIGTAYFRDHPPITKEVRVVLE